jgi:hypothetical protein
VADRERSTAARRFVAALAFGSCAVFAAPASAFNHAAIGGQDEGEIDINANFIGQFGNVEPTERPTTFQDADIKIFNVGAGYTIGEVGPFSQFYVRVDGAYFIAGEESITDPGDELYGTKMFGEDRGGYVTATVSTNFIHEPRYTFGAYLQGTVPIDVSFQKFSSVRLHWIAGGTTVGVFLTDPTKLVRLAFSNRLFVGSGAYDGDYQHNASAAMTNLFSLEFARWLLPWRMGISVGPYFAADVNEHVNRVYHDAYARLSPDLVEGDRIRSMQLAVAVLPYFEITDHAALELGYVQRLFGYDLPATQYWNAGIRVSF